MTKAEYHTMIQLHFPGAELCTDLDGQLVIHTGKALDKNNNVLDYDDVVDFKPS